MPCKRGGRLPVWPPVAQMQEIPETLVCSGVPLSRAQVAAHSGPLDTHVVDIVMWALGRAGRTGGRFVLRQWAHLCGGRLVTSAGSATMLVPYVTDSHVTLLAIDLTSGNTQLFDPAEGVVRPPSAAIALLQRAGVSHARACEAPGLAAPPQLLQDPDRPDCAVCVLFFVMWLAYGFPVEQFTVQEGRRYIQQVLCAISD